MTPTPLARGLISALGLDLLLAAGVVCVYALACLPPLSGAVVIGVPLLIVAGCACLGYVRRMNESLPCDCEDVT